MVRLIANAMANGVRALIVSLLPARSSIVRPSLRHYLTLLPLLILLPLFTLYHAIGWLLDEILFRGYRQVEVREPLFVLGVPRSGTTALHEHLTRDQQFTTFATWECLFASSVTWRRFWMAVARIDRAIGRPGGRGLTAVERLIAGGMEDVHPFRFAGPEEDYFAFMPVLWCFVLIVPFPDGRWLWDYTDFDERVPAPLRRALLDYYHASIQRHLYVHGQDKRYLSKNAAFAPLARSLTARYPDGHFLVCLREPRRALSSQLSTLKPAMDGFHGRWDEARFADRMTEAFLRYYRHLFATFMAHDGRRAVIVPMAAQQQRLAATICGAYAALELEADEPFMRYLEAQDQAARRWTSPHRHRLAEQASLSAQAEQAIADIEARFDFARDEILVVGATPEALEATA